MSIATGRRHGPLLCALLCAGALACGSDDSSGGAGDTGSSVVAGMGGGTDLPATPGGDMQTDPGTPGGDTQDPVTTGGDGDTTTTDAPPAYSYSACELADHVGGFWVGLVKPVGLDPYTALEGLVKDGIVPTNVPELVRTSGECSLVRGRNLFCDPECAFDEVCSEDGQCLPEPVGQDMGTAEITGLVDGTITMESRPTRYNYTNVGVTLSYPGFAEGAAIALTTAGGSMAPLNLSAEGVAPLAIHEAEVALIDGSPATVTWDAPAQAGRSRVLVSLNISLHGGDPVRIECDAQDDGALEIPADLVSELLTFDYSGFPGITLRRQTSMAVQGADGCIDFRVFSSVERHPVQIEGLTSCNETMGDCPSGQSCNLQLMLCE